MERKALIIYMDNSPSGKLPGPERDFENIQEYLVSDLGGCWTDDEIIACQNPKIAEVKAIIQEMNYADYTFIVFTGHGEYDQYNGRQHMELMDGDITIRDLKTGNSRQTIIIDSCRGYKKIIPETIKKSKLFSMEEKSHIISTRQIFENYLSQTEEGLTVLYAASKNQSALDTNMGAAYISSLIQAAKQWGRQSQNNILDLKKAHTNAIDYMYENFDDVTQIPIMNGEKRKRYFPFGVKISKPLYG